MSFYIGEGVQIITVPDPITGQPVQKVIQTVIDPTTGLSSQVMMPMNEVGSKLLRMKFHFPLFLIYFSNSISISFNDKWCKPNYHFN